LLETACKAQVGITDGSKASVRVACYIAWSGRLIHALS